MIDKHIAQHYVWGERCDGWHLVQTAELSVIHERMPPGTSEVPHRHGHARQFFFVLQGTATVVIAGHAESVGRHQGVEIASGVAHCVHNRTIEPIEFLVISQPAAHGDRLE